MKRRHGWLLGDQCKTCRYLIEVCRREFRCVQAADLPGNGMHWLAEAEACGRWEDARE